MANETIAQVENAIIAALEAEYATQNGGYAKTIESYSGQFEQAVETVVLLFPAMLVVFGGDEYNDANGQNTIYNERDRFTVFVGCSNLRGDVARRHGVASEIGLYEMLDDVRSTLVGSSLGLDIEPFRIIRRKALHVSKRANVYALEFETQLDYTNL